MKIVWQDLPKQQNLFTTRNAVMRNLDTNKIIQYYSANTKIVVVQKAQKGEKTYYRTAPAKERSLNWAFEAAAFGLPNEVAPSAPSAFSIDTLNTLPPSHSQSRTQNKHVTKKVSSKDGEKKPQGIIRRIAKIFKK